MPFITTPSSSRFVALYELILQQMLTGSSKEKLLRQVAVMMVIIETTFINDECSDNDYDDASGDRWVIETDGLLVKNVTRLVCLTPLGSPKTDKPKENL